MDNAIDFKTLRQYITVTLSDLPNYSTKAVVLNTEVNIDVGYNPRSMKRWVKIYDANKNVLLPQTFLSYDRRCELNFNAELNDLFCYVTLEANDGTKDFDGYDYLEWSKDFKLCFSGFRYTYFDIFNKMVVQHLVGNSEN